MKENHNKSARHQRKGEGLAGSSDVRRVILPRLCLTHDLLPACCRAAGLVYTAALFALSSPCFWRGVEKFCLVPSQG